jgi:CheY-like chemotaxis protein
MAHILVVEDDGDIQAAVQDLLVAEGHQVTVAGNGAEALAVLAGKSRPHCILLDLMMPVMNGWQMLIALQQDVRLAPIPVIVASAAPSAIAPELARAVIHKPYQLDDLLDVIARFTGADASRAA